MSIILKKTKIKVKKNPIILNIMILQKLETAMEEINLDIKNF